MYAGRRAEGGAGDGDGGRMMVMVKMMDGDGIAGVSKR